MFFQCSLKSCCIFQLDQSSILFTPCRTGGGSCRGKIRSQHRSLAPPLSLRPGLWQNDTTAANEGVSRRKEATTDKTAKYPHSLPARNRNWTAAQHSQYTLSHTLIVMRWSAKAGLWLNITENLIWLRGFVFGNLNFSQDHKLEPVCVLDGGQILKITSYHTYVYFCSCGVLKTGEGISGSDEEPKLVAFGFLTSLFLSIKACNYIPYYGMVFLDRSVWHFFLCFVCVCVFYLFVCLSASAAEKTVSPNQAQPRHPKASPGQMTRRGRERGDHIVWLKQPVTNFSFTKRHLITAFQGDLLCTITFVFSTHCNLFS